MNLNESKYYLFDLKTKLISKQSWKTYTGALRNANQTQIVSSLDGIKWALKNPDWCNNRLSVKF